VLALFDLSFQRFIAPSIAKVVYVLAMIGIALIYLLFVVRAFDASTGFGVLVLFVIGPLVSLIYLVFIRVFLEALLAQILTAQNTSALVAQGGGTPGRGPSSGGPGGGGSYPMGPPPGQYQQPGQYPPNPSYPQQ
jgi:uncharacterized membrane protein YgcG